MSNILTNVVLTAKEELDKSINKASQTVKEFTKEEIQRMVASGEMANMTIEDGTITSEKLEPTLASTIESNKNDILSNSAEIKSLGFIKNVLNLDDEDVVQGKFLNFENIWVDNVNFNESGFIPCKAGDVFIKNNQINKALINFCFFDEKKNFVLGFYGSNYPYVVVPNNDNIKFMRIPFSRKEPVALYNTNKYIKDFIPYNYLFSNNSQLKNENFNTLDFAKIKNVFNPDDADIIEDGYLANNTIISNVSFIESGFIPCDFGEYFRFQNGINNLQKYVEFYDKDKKFIKEIGYNGHIHPYIFIDDINIKFFRIPLSKEDRRTLALYNTELLIKEFIPYGENIYRFPEFITENFSSITPQEPINEENHWKNKTWYAYGTSMTSVAQGKYIPVVQKLSGMDVVNKGISGGCLTPDGFGKGNVKQAIMNTIDGKLNADLITLEVLPNEGATVGDIYAVDNNSFCGCFNQSLRYLQENTNAQIVVIIMIGDNKTSPEVKTKRGITQYEFHNIIKQVASLNGVPVIDVLGESGFGYGRVKSGKYQVDNIHLNDLGGDNVGRYIWSKLKDIPNWKSAK